MKRSIAIGAVCFVFATLAATAQKPAEHAPPKAAAANAQFEMLKKLEGTWTGKAGHGDQAFDATVIYKVTSGGSAVMETLFAGSDHEMITMYCMNGDDLVLTHYCTMGNQPHMKMAKPSATEPNVLTFECTGHGGNMKEADAHMHKAVITIVDADHLKAAWTMQTDNKPGEVAKFDLSRNKS